MIKFYLTRMEENIHAKCENLFAFFTEVFEACHEEHVLSPCSSVIYNLLATP